MFLFWESGSLPRSSRTDRSLPRVCQANLNRPVGGFRAEEPSETGEKTRSTLMCRDDSIRGPWGHVHLQETDTVGELGAR